MSPVARIRRRLRAERGFTLIELLVAISIGAIVVTAAINLMEASVRASNEVVNRFDGLQKGRLALEEITQRLRAQVCPDKATPAIVDGNRQLDVLLHRAQCGRRRAAIPVFAPEGRRITFAAGKITEEIWNTLASPFANTFAGAALDRPASWPTSIYPQASQPRTSGTSRSSTTRPRPTWSLCLRSRLPIRLAS